MYTVEHSRLAQTVLPITPGNSIVFVRKGGVSLTVSLLPSTYVISTELRDEITQRVESSLYSELSSLSKEAYSDREAQHFSWLLFALAPADVTESRSRWCGDPT